MEFYLQKCKVAFNEKKNVPEHEVDREFYRIPAAEPVIRGGKIVQPFLEGHVDDEIRSSNRKEYELWLKAGRPDQRNPETDLAPVPEETQELEISKTNTPSREFDKDDLLKDLGAKDGGKVQDEAALDKLPEGEEVK